MATTQLEVLALWTRARHATDANARQTCLSRAEQLTLAETDPREFQFADQILAQFQQWVENRTAAESTTAEASPTPALTDGGGRYRLRPAGWPQG